MNSSTSSRGTRILGSTTLVVFAVLLLFALVISPQDQVQEQTVRMFYVHVPTAFVAFTAFFVTVFASIGYLIKRTEWWDLVAGASAEMGAVLLAVTLVSGSLWGRVTWGVYWTWDARLTLTALLFVLAIGYLAVRRLPMERDQRARLAAVIGLLLAPTTVVCHFATTWWQGLHQGETFSFKHTTIGGTMLFSFFLGMIVFSLFYVWMMIHRFRILWLENRVEDLGLDVALAERRAEAQPASADDAPPFVAPGGAVTGLLAHTTILNSPDADLGFQWTLVLLCWGVVLLSLAFLVVRTIQRGRKLSDQVPEDKRRWM